MLGGFSSAFFLYGIALAYAATGSTKLDEIGLLVASSAQQPDLVLLLMLSMILLLVGFAFKVSAVPFHMWTPDAYQGAPTLVTGFMSTARQGGGVCGVRARLPHRARAVPRRMAARFSPRLPV